MKHLIRKHSRQLGLLSLSTGLILQFVMNEAKVTQYLNLLHFTIGLFLGMAIVLLLYSFYKPAH